jgi:hypothetical protein
MEECGRKMLGDKGRDLDIQYKKEQCTFKYQK